MPGTVAPWRHGLTMILVGFVLAMTASIELLYAIRLGLSTVEVTAFIVVSAVGMIAVDVLGTHAVTRIDARMLLVAGLVLFAASEAAFAASAGVAGLLGARILQSGSGAAIAGATLQTAVRTGRQPHRVLGTNQGLQLLGAAVGAPVGGVLAGLLAGLAGYRLSFLFCAGASVMVALAARVLLPRLPAQTTGRPRIGLPDLTIAPVLRFALALGSFGNYLRSGIENTALPLVGNANGMSSATIGLALGVLSAVEIVVLARSGRIFESVAPARCLAIALSLGIAAVTLLATTHSPPFFFGAAAVFGVVDGIALSAPPVLVVALSPNAASGVATYRIACGIGSFVGAGSVNMLIAVLGSMAGLLAVAVTLGAGVILARSTGRRVGTAAASSP